jgi:hypothetical protein
MGALLILLGIGMLGISIIIMMQSKDPVLQIISIILLFTGIAGIAKGNQILNDTPEYRLWLKHEKIKDFKIQQHQDSIEKQKKIWLWKKHKQLNDSIKSLNIK